MEDLYCEIVDFFFHNWVLTHLDTILQGKVQLKQIPECLWKILISLPVGKVRLRGLAPSKFIVIQSFIQVNIIPFETKIKEETKADRIMKLVLVELSRPLMVQKEENKTSKGTSEPSSLFPPPNLPTS